MSTINDRSAYIEETGLLFETFGMTRMAGRILGYLMVTDKEMVSFDELTQVLQASKSSISTNVKAMTQTKFIKPVSVPGDRKTYYMLSDDISWVELFYQRTEQLKYLKALYEKGLNLRSNKKDKSSVWLENAIEFYDWIILEFPEILKKWQDFKSNK
ncbi:GbsR/MarR family transcriptional regulator [Alkalitalea saponilacus]|uniref:DNA-binding transcriptional regulator GbsR, MarR family n=1 Tax=Alkalitalea saponilacus TaxID=889453 RepID=A0A1T5CFS6_9BACT|nr:MarR family transcriptional regulator [Alkalitalea saponilacus]ASB49854.1 hypothetical protein CDL62_12270 [Alkalitalea saponilacus]SKB58279.1 DNA-binding transcriptional regulator GbsR, MarR family [Alkalitalea saponilacus]